MPEGPSIIILKEEVQPFLKKKIIAVSGNSKIEKERMLNKKIIAFRSWGKQFFICFDDLSLRIHFLLFGSYLVNEDKEATPRLRLEFDNGFINLYSCSVKFIEESLDDMYDEEVDIMSEKWNASKAEKYLLAHPDMLVADALLDQNVFSGSGNIIKNEVLFRTKIHPANKIKDLPEEKLLEMIAETRIYAFDFLRWKKQFVLRKHWLAHTKKICVECGGNITKKYLGKTNRRTFFCENCQVKYD